MSEETMKESEDTMQLSEGSIQVAATAKPEGSEERLEGIVVVEIGSTLDEISQKYGEGTTKELFTRAFVVKLQSAIRRELENGTHPGDLQEVLGNFDPNETRAKDPKSDIMRNFAKLPIEEQEKIIANLQAQAQS